MAITRACFVVNPGKPEALRLARELGELLRTHGVSAICEEHVGSELGLPPGPPPQFGESDLCVTLGGDGTLIHASYLLGHRPVPILGFNLGALGFMTEFPVLEARKAVERVLAGDYTVEPRMKLRVHLHRGAEGRKLLDAEVLNDAVINKGALARIIELEASIDGNYVTSYRADGVIVSTPTGSTAYSLSAGGPILYPTMHAVLVNPICPHTLAQRPLVIPDDRQINLRLKSDSSEVYLTLDGQTGSPLMPGDRIQIQQSKNRVLLIKNPELDFFSILRTKLGWGGERR